MALVEQPTAIATVMALRNASWLRILRGVNRFSPTTCRRCAARSRRPLPDTVGVGCRMKRRAGSCRASRPSPSWWRLSPWSRRCRSSARCPPRHRPRRRRKHCVVRHVHASEPEPKTLPFQLLSSIGPAGRSPAGPRSWRQQGRSLLLRSRPLRPLVHGRPRKSSSRPSPEGCGRASWSALSFPTATARAVPSASCRLQVDAALTSSTRLLKPACWQGWASDQVLRMAMTGRPTQSSGA